MRAARKCVQRVGARLPRNGRKGSGGGQAVNITARKKYSNVRVSCSSKKSIIPQSAGQVDGSYSRLLDTYESVCLGNLVHRPSSKQKSSGIARSTQLLFDNQLSFAHNEGFEKSAGLWIPPAVKFSFAN